MQFFWGFCFVLYFFFLILPDFEFLSLPELPPFPFLLDVHIFKAQLMRTLGIIQGRAIECLGLDGGHLILG